jgi:hypothetical protein
MSFNLIGFTFSDTVPAQIKKKKITDYDSVKKHSWKMKTVKAASEKKREMFNLPIQIKKKKKDDSVSPTALVPPEASTKNKPKKPNMMTFADYLGPRTSTGFARASTPIPVEQHVGQLIVKTFVPEIKDDVTRKRIFENAEKCFKENQDAQIILFGKGAITPSAETLWPVCKINNLEFSDFPGHVSNIKYETKFLGAYFRNPMKATEEEMMTFYVFKEFSRDLLLEIPQQFMEEILKKGKEFLAYLKSIDGIKIAKGENLPQCPMPCVVGEYSETARLIIQIDEPRPFHLKKDARFYSPTITIRQQRFSPAKLDKPEYWFHDKLGVTQSAANFFFMTESSVKNYMWRIKHSVGNFAKDYVMNLEKLDVLASENSDAWRTDEIVDEDDYQDDEMMASNSFIDSVEVLPIEVENANTSWAQ